jgi:hypothetical protein
MMKKSYNNNGRQEDDGGRQEEQRKNKEKKAKKKTKEEKKKEEEEKRGEIFLNLSQGWASEMKKNNPRQCLVWFRLNGVGSSQNGQNSLIHNWCIGGCWLTQDVSM